MRNRAESSGAKGKTETPSGRGGQRLGTREHEDEFYSILPAL